ncbi:MerR family transcriptional regulator [Butyrivibrio sp. MC2021]|uniref:MerR family transcriptional regulator n=1 Tax=Butyrivibrio sp. MC2021 TaxID=1408306 RepID=UPI00047D0611|nr:MerR family transcriptional regulator [Butyrivibrio sp. MC2021]
MDKNNYSGDKMDYSLSVGQFAKLCETTRDTLRYYYEQDILIPRIDSENGYHYYSASQISSFFFISTMRQAGCSIKEIKNIIHNSTKDSLTNMVNSKILDMQMQLYLINKKISSLHLAMWILGKYDSDNSGIPSLDIIPEISITATEIKNSGKAYHTADIASDISVHLKTTSSEGALSGFPTGVTISYADLVNKKYVYNSIVSLSLLPADNIQSRPLNSTLAVTCYHDNMDINIDETYEKITQFIQNNNLIPCSDLYSISLFNLYSKEKMHNYFKYLFICVTQ